MNMKSSPCDSYAPRYEEYRGMEVQQHTFLVSLLDGQLHAPPALPPGEGMGEPQVMSGRGG